jgi:hypothetical protein
MHLGSGPVVQDDSQRSGTYRLELIRCGRHDCARCAKGPAHGPYWYLYYRGRDGKLVSKYIGKELPAEARIRRAEAAAREALRQARVYQEARSRLWKARFRLLT